MGGLLRGPARHISAVRGAELTGRLFGRAVGSRVPPHCRSSTTSSFAPRFATSYRRSWPSPSSTATGYRLLLAAEALRHSFRPRQGRRATTASRRRWTSGPACSAMRPWVYSPCGSAPCGPSESAGAAQPERHLFAVQALEDRLRDLSRRAEQV